MNQWAASGWDAVDMETATTFAVAEHFEMDSASLLYVFDNPLQHGDIVLNERKKDERRRHGNAAMADWTFRVVRRFLEDSTESS